MNDVIAFHITLWLLHIPCALSQPNNINTWNITSSGHMMTQKLHSSHPISRQHLDFTTLKPTRTARKLRVLFKKYIKKIVICFPHLGGRTVLFYGINIGVSRVALKQLPQSYKCPFPTWACESGFLEPSLSGRTSFHPPPNRLRPSQETAESTQPLWAIKLYHHLNPRYFLLINSIRNLFYYLFLSPIF